MKNYFKLIAILVLLIFIAGCSTRIDPKDQEIASLKQRLENQEKFYNYYTKAVTQYGDALYTSSNADYNYELWSWAYNNGDYITSINYCVAARGGYVIANQNYQKAISYFEEANKTANEKYGELINYYILTSDLGIRINWYDYETCEYFESASQAYSNGFYETGDSEIEKGNKKIFARDSLIITHNKYVSKIEVLQEGL